MSKNTGGPAFPVPLNPGESYQGHGPYDGMTLRDYFAAKAAGTVWANLSDMSVDSAASVTAKFAYKIADAMLKEREK